MRRFSLLQALITGLPSLGGAPKPAHPTRSRVRAKAQHGGVIQHSDGVAYEISSGGVWRRLTPRSYVVRRQEKAGKR